MPTSRDEFLQRVREAVQAGNRPGSAAPLPARGEVGYQGAGADPVARFRDELAAAGGEPYLVNSDDEAAAKVMELVQAKAARNVLLGKSAVLDRLDLKQRLRDRGLSATYAGDVAREQCRDVYFAADVGITGADYLVAETGSVVVCSRPEEPRSTSLLPPVHIVVAERSQLVADLFDLFDELPRTGDRPTLPSGLAIITGPSKTGDIELKLVTGVHGPGDVHVVLIT